jgi:hypothetical protein
MPDADPITADVQIAVRDLQPGEFAVDVFDWLTGERDSQHSQAARVSGDGSLSFSLDLSAYRKDDAGGTAGAGTAIVYLHRVEAVP